MSLKVFICLKVSKIGYTNLWDCITERRVRHPSLKGEDLPSALDV